MIPAERTAARRAIRDTSLFEITNS